MELAKTIAPACQNVTGHITWNQFQIAAQGVSCTCDGELVESLACFEKHFSSMLILGHEFLHALAETQKGSSDGPALLQRSLSLLKGQEWE